MMKRIILSVLLAIFFCLSAWAEEPFCHFKLGAAVPLSGDVAWVGEEIRDAMLMAKADVGKEFGNKVSIDFQFEDTAYSQMQAATAAAKMIHQDKVDGILTLWDGTDVIAPIAERAGVVTVGIRWNYHVTEGRPLTFTLESTYQSYMDSTFALLQKLEKKRVVILYEQLPGWELAIDYVNKVAKGKGFEIVMIEPLPANQTDYRVPILKAVQKRPDAVLNFGNPPVVDLVVKQINNIVPKVFHTGYYSLITDRKTIEGIPFVDQLGFYPEFEQRFKALYGRMPKSRAGHGYELVRMIAYSLKNICNKGEQPTPKKVAVELSRIKDFPSVLGPLTTGQNRNIEHPNFWKVAKRGEFLPYQ